MTYIGSGIMQYIVEVYLNYQNASSSDVLKILKGELV